MENVQNQETVKVNEKKNESKLFKAVKFFGKVAIGVAAAIGVDYVTTGGKGTTFVTTKGKELVKKVTEKKNQPVPVQNNHQGGQQRPHYENRPRPNYNGNNNRPVNVEA